MQKIMTGVAIATLLAIAPAVAKEDKAANAQQSEIWNENKKMLEQEGQNREPGEDGMFQGKPVVQGPAKWDSVYASGASPTKTK